MNRSSFFRVFSSILFTLSWIGAIFFSLIFISWEIQSVQNQLYLQPLQSQVTPVSCQADIRNENKIVHIDCPLNKLTTFHPPGEFTWNLKPFHGVFFEMKVEMYQWILKPNILSYSIKPDWYSSTVNTSNFPYFVYNTHINPDFFPSINGAGRRYAPHVYAGTYRLNKEYIIKFNKKKQLSLIDDGYYTPCNEHPPVTINYATTQVYNDALYTGNPHQPKIGDIKITFWGSTASHVSIIAQQTRNKLSRVVELQSVSSLPSRSVTHLVYEGDYGPDQMFALFHKQFTGHPLIIWAVRILSVLFLASSISLTSICFQSFKKTAVLPFICGSVLLSIGSLLLIVSIIWLYFHLGYAAIMGSLGLVTLISGRYLWSCGKEVLIAPYKDIEFIQDASQSVPLMSDNEEHFYQPL